MRGSKGSRGYGSHCICSSCSEPRQACAMLDAVTERAAASSRRALPGKKPRRCRCLEPVDMTTWGSPPSNGRSTKRAGSQAAQAGERMGKYKRGRNPFLTLYPQPDSCSRVSAL